MADVFGVPGRRAIESRLPELRHELDVDFCVVNGENAADGAGLTAKLASRLLERGADVVTTGNHVWRQRDLYPLLEKSERVLRPANFGGPGAPGRGACVAPARDGTPVAVLNLMGGLFMDSQVHPFSVAEQYVEELRRETPIVVVDFHAEATSEKIALARLLDGRVTAVIGTHTHVQTNDARVLSGRNGGADRRRHDRAARLRHRRPRRAGDRAHAQRHAGALPAGRGRRAHRGGADRLRLRRAGDRLRGRSSRRHVGDGSARLSAAASATTSATKATLRATRSQTGPESSVSRPSK